MLSVRDTMTLDLERRRWKCPGAKDAAIRDTLGEWPVGYYQRLKALLDRSEALSHDAMPCWSTARVGCVTADDQRAVGQLMGQPAARRDLVQPHAEPRNPL